MAGTRVVYFGATAGIVLLEKLAHVDAEVLPGGVSVVEVVAGEADDLHGLAQTQARGEGFFRKNAACMLRVRSVNFASFSPSRMPWSP